MNMDQDVLDTVARFSKQGPVDVRAIISALGIEYDEKTLPSGASGQITYQDGSFQIVVNAADVEARKRFTAAHELAHFMLHRDLLEKRGKLNRHTDILFGDNAQNNPPAPFSPSHEVQANRYAAELLMPAARVRASWNKAEDNVEQLAKKLGVSLKAMKVRLKNLGLRDTVD
jgi:Zn-dependent peptidase ImmA (M78 family)